MEIIKVVDLSIWFLLKYLELLMEEKTLVR